MLLGEGLPEISIHMIEHIHGVIGSHSHCVVGIAITVGDKLDSLRGDTRNKHIFLVVVVVQAHNAIQGKPLRWAIHQLHLGIYIILFLGSLNGIHHRQRIGYIIIVDGTIFIGTIVGNQLTVNIGAVWREQWRTTICRQHWICLVAHALLHEVTLHVSCVDRRQDFQFTTHQDRRIDLRIIAVVVCILQGSLIAIIAQRDVVLGDGITTFYPEQIVHGRRVAQHLILPICVEAIKLGIIGLRI